MQLWIDKYRPREAGQMVAQKKAIEETQKFLQSWSHGRALLCHGQPGVGKSLLAELMARERGWALVHVNASDSRSGSELEALLGQSTRQATLFHSGKLIVIDEVDGISGQERGASAALLKIIRESKFPIILIANDPWGQKLRSIRNYCTVVKFAAIPYPSIAKRLEEIAEKEGVSADPEILKNLARWASGDIRSAILDLQLLAAGRKEVTEADMESLGFRERERSVYDIMPTLFYSGSLGASRKVIREADKDPDEIFWWIEGNIFRAYKSPESLAASYDLLSRVDIFRSLVMRQQNWRFKAYMVDIMSGISAFRDSQPGHGFVPFRPPDRLIMLGQTRERRDLMDSIAGKLGRQLHCSKRVAKREYLPLLRHMVGSGRHGIMEGIGATEDEMLFLGR